MNKRWLTKKRVAYMRRYTARLMLDGAVQCNNGRKTAKSSKVLKEGDIVISLREGCGSAMHVHVQYTRKAAKAVKGLMLAICTGVPREMSARWQSPLTRVAYERTALDSLIWWPDKAEDRRPMALSFDLCADNGMPLPLSATRVSCSAVDPHIFLLIPTSAVDPHIFL
jgi:hypothetical protein